MARLAYAGHVSPSDYGDLTLTVSRDLDKRVQKMREQDFELYAELHTELTKAIIKSMQDTLSAIARAFSG